MYIFYLPISQARLVAFLISHISYLISHISYLISHISNLHMKRYWKSRRRGLIMDKQEGVALIMKTPLS